MIKQYATPVLQNEISKNLCFVKKNLLFLRRSSSKLSSTEFKGKYKNNHFRWFVPLWCTFLKMQEQTFNFTSFKRYIKWCFIVVIF